ncbi:MAG TPA: hypothetical protein VJ838_11230, partial [Gaiellaceae bacterium]|nr:hypothetical protein [Gaiellaceae bacterium]
MKGLAFGAAVAVLATLVGLAAPKGQATARKLACGTDRWTVKTLQDRPHLLPNQVRTVKWLVHRPPPAHRTETRMAFEYHVFTVVAQVIAVHLEGDSDYHILLKEHGWPMIAESPAPDCTAGAKLYYRNRMAQARQAVRVCGQARITGVAFFDTEHGQPGVAPN